MGRTRTDGPDEFEPTKFDCTYIDKLVENLDSRFPEDELQTLECLDIILNPKRYPDDLASIGDYGTGQLNQLLTFYDTCVDAERAKSHFLLF